MVRSRKYHAHDETNQYNEGDLVEVMVRSRKYHAHDGRSTGAVAFRRDQPKGRIERHRCEHVALRVRRQYNEGDLVEIDQ